MIDWHLTFFYIRSFKIHLSVNPSTSNAGVKKKACYPNFFWFSLIYIYIYISKSTCEFYGFILRINRSIEYSNQYFIHKKYIPWTATQWPTARKSSWSASSARSCPQIWKRPWCLHCRCLLYMYLKKGYGWRGYRSRWSVVWQTINSTVNHIH